MKLDAPIRTVHLVATAANFQFARDAIERSAILGVDAERASGFRYSQRAYLLQFATETEIWLFDPPELDAAVAGWNLELAQAAAGKLWILHAATQDLPNLQSLEIYPTALYDTEIAARLIGLERFGLAAICAELLDIELAKEHSAADWSQRPLTLDLMNYAALDVDVLFDLKEQLDARLAEMGRTEWALQEFEHLLGFRPKVRAQNPWVELPGYSKLKQLKQQQIAAALWLARDAIASETDTAPGRLIPDRSIIAAAAAAPKSKGELAALKEFHGRASRSKLSTWWQAIQESAGMEVDTGREYGEIPNHRSWERKFPDAHQRLVASRKIVVDLAAELKLPAENLISPTSLRALCFKPSEAPIGEQLQNLAVRDWQIELLQAPLSAALSSQ